MKNTISEELKTQIIREAILNANSLLQITKENSASKYATVRVRYVDKTGIKSVIAEDIICYMNPYGAISDNDGVTSYYSADGSFLKYNYRAVAFYTKTADTESELSLQTLYDLRFHRFVEDDSKRAVYQELFPQNIKINVFEKK